MWGSATLTTVASRLAMALAATVASSAVRPFGVCSASPSSATVAATLIRSRYRRGSEPVDRGNEPGEIRREVRVGVGDEQHAEQHEQRAGDALEHRARPAQA